MLGKQWLNRYESIDKRGSVVECSQNRQRKLDGVVTWYFDTVLESLPVMLQVGLLLLGCALSRYFWDIDTTIASVIIGFTSLGMLFYLFIVVAGAASETFPYQTPGAHVLRYIGFWSMVHSAASIVVSVPSAVVSTTRTTIRGSKIIETIRVNVWFHHHWRSVRQTMRLLGDLVLEVSLAFVIDVYRLGRVTIRALFSLLVGASRLAHRVYNRLGGTYFSLRRRLNQQAPAMDLRCMSWTLQTSLDKLIHLSTLKHLIEMTEFTTFDPTLVANCFNVLIGCVRCNKYRVVILRGLEQLALVSARCFLRALLHLVLVDPTSSVLVDLRRRYTECFPSEPDPMGPPFHSTMIMIHALSSRVGNLRYIRWHNYKPSSEEHIPFAQYMTEAAHVGYQRTRHQKVPRWILRFAFRSLSLDPPSPPSVVAECLTVIAIDLRCNVVNITTLDERYAQT